MGTIGRQHDDNRQRLPMIGDMSLLHDRAMTRLRAPRSENTDSRHGERRARPHLWRSRWAAIGAAVAVTLGGGAVHFASADSSAASDIIAITPVRILDTRNGVDLGLAGPFVSATGQNLKVTGSVPTPAGAQTVVPDGATGVLLNVTVVQPTAAGFIAVRPSGTPGAPQTSSLNFGAGDITPNAVFVALPTSGASAGSIEITYDAFGAAGPTTEVLVDVTGYTTAAPDVYTKAEVDAAFAAAAADADAEYLPLFARVNAAGVLQQGRNVTAAIKMPVPPNPPGFYIVAFDRNISECSYHATANGPGIATTGLQGTGGVAVLTYNLAGAPADIGFSVVVHC